MLPLTEEQLHEVTAQAGFALWQTQIVEATVGTYLVFVHQATPHQARTEVEAMFAHAHSQTLGRLLRAIKATGNAPQLLIDALDAFIEKRNWLVHHSRHECHRDMYSTSGRAALIARLAQIADDALGLAKLFQEASEAHLERLGISREQIDRDSAKLLDEWISS